jgi:hypothetical protein
MKKYLKVVLLSCLISFVNIATAQTPVSDPDDECIRRCFQFYGFCLQSAQRNYDISRWYCLSEYMVCEMGWEYFDPLSCEAKFGLCELQAHYYFLEFVQRECDGGYLECLQAC